MKNILRLGLVLSLGLAAAVHAAPRVWTDQVTEQFPAAFIGANSGSTIAVAGAGDLYAGWTSLAYRMNLLTSEDGADRYVFDPKFVTSEGTVRAPLAGDIPGVKVASLEAIPKAAAVFILSPNRFHVGQIEELVKSGVRGVYCEKPIAIDGADLARLEIILSTANGKIVPPMYFADHYLFSALGLTALMGKEIPYPQLILIVDDKTRRIGKSLKRKRPLLGKIARLEARVLETGDENLKNRSWLRSRSKGGGVMLDLLVHVLNVAGHLGFGIESIERSTLKVFPSDNSLPRGKFIPLGRAGADEAEDYAGITGRLSPAGAFDFEVAQFAAARSNYILLEDIKGFKLKLWLDTHQVDYSGPEGQLLGKVVMPVDPYFLAIHQALTYFRAPASLAGSPGLSERGFYWELQANSIRWIGRFRAAGEAKN